MNGFPKSEVIMHYASPYYDPVKAHEYYEEHKQLKGRHSTAGLNETGRAAAQYVRNQLSEERKKKVEKSKEYMQGRISASSAHSKSKKQIIRESYKSTVAAHKEQMNSSIASLRESLKNLSAEDKKGSAGESIRNRITSLREANSNQRKQLQEILKQANTSVSEEHKTTSASARQQHKDNVEQYKKEYETAYERELDNLKSDSSMVSKKKRK